jgi:ABC-type Fe3+ transport system substrate-binding protein
VICYIEHTGQNFAVSFGPFESPEAAREWLASPEIQKAGVRGPIIPMIPPDTDPAKIWNTDPWEETGDST